jgi:polysaccharide export outer membrane protein
MREKAWSVIVMVFMGLFFIMAPGTVLSQSRIVMDYRIGPGDVLDISDWKNPDLSKVVTVLPDGKISFPLIGEVVAGGKTIAELKKELEERISKYVTDPILSVIVSRVNSLEIYIIGKVNKPGSFVLDRNINVLQALTMAGGLNPFAQSDKIKIFREQGTRTSIIQFNYDEVVKNNNLEMNIMLNGGDIIVVP